MFSLALLRSFFLYLPVAIQARLSAQIKVRFDFPAAFRAFVDGLFIRTRRGSNGAGVV